jgi:L-ascorbate metabolism protein UlaG (beta-lactamase superfamily)
MGWFCLVEMSFRPKAQGSIFFVGNATVILSYAGFTILTDPRAANVISRRHRLELG